MCDQIVKPNYLFQYCATTVLRFHNIIPTKYIYVLSLLFVSLNSQIFIENRFPHTCITNSFRAFVLMKIDKFLHNWEIFQQKKCSFWQWLSGYFEFLKQNTNSSRNFPKESYSSTHFYTGHIPIIKKNSELYKFIFP